MIATFSTRIKDAGTAVRHSRRTFSYPRPPECLENRISTADEATDRPAGPLATQAAQQSQSRPPKPPRPKTTDGRPARRPDLQAIVFWNVFLLGGPMEFSLNAMVLLWQPHSRCATPTPVLAQSAAAQAYGPGLFAQGCRCAEAQTHMFRLMAKDLPHGFNRHWSKCCQEVQSSDEVGC